MNRALSSSSWIACVMASVLLVAPPARATGVDPSVATPVQREQAQQRFNRGRDLFVKKDYKRALAEFEGSHDIVASPNARLYVARCHREMGRLVQAYVEFGRVAAEAHEFEHEDPRYVKTAESASNERDELAPKLGFVRVTVEHATEETKLTIGGDEIKRAGWGEPAPVAPGTSDVIVETPGHVPVKSTVTLQPAERKDITLDATSADPPAAAPPPAPAPVADEDEASVEKRHRLRTIAFVAGGVGVAGLATFAVAGSMANGTYSDLQSQCHGPCPPSKADQVSSGKTQQTVANIGLVVGIAGVATGVTLFVLSLPKSRPAADASVALTAGPTWVGMRGAF